METRQNFVIGDEVFCLEVANTFLRRFCGLMLRKELQAHTGMLLEPCSSVHSCFMRFPIDVLYLDKKRCVIEKETLRPWKVGKFVRGATAVVELPEGAGSEIPIGRTITANK